MDLNEGLIIFLIFDYISNYFKIIENIIYKKKIFQ